MARRLAEAFGARLQEVRRECRWKQAAFADAMGVSRTTASNIERGRQRIFLDQVYRAAEILGVPVERLLPPAHLLATNTILHVAVDDPLPRAAARTLAEVVRELDAAKPTARKRVTEG